MKCPFCGQENTRVIDFINTEEKSDEMPLLQQR